MEDNSAQRRLSKELIDTDNRLSAWARWALEHAENIGWPPESLAWRLIRHYEAGGTFGNVAPAIFMPPEVDEVEQIVTNLPKELSETLKVRYLTRGPVNAWCRILKVSQSVFSRRLDNARWAVKVLLEKTA